MANLSAPPVSGGNFVCPEPGLYNAVVVGVEEVPNQFFKAGEDNPNKATQFKWTIRLVDNDEFDGTEVFLYTSSYLSRHEKAKLPKFLAVVDRDFNIDVGYAGMEDLTARTVYSKLSVVLDQKAVQVTNDSGDTETRLYPRISAFLKSKDTTKWAPSADEMSEDIPF